MVGLVVCGCGGLATLPAARAQTVVVRKARQPLRAFTDRLHRRRGLRFAAPMMAYRRCTVTVRPGERRLAELLREAAESARLDLEWIEHRGGRVAALWDRDGNGPGARLTRLAVSRDAAERCIAARWLPTVGSRRALELGLKLLVDRDRRVRLYAAEQLLANFGARPYGTRVSPISLVAPGGLGRALAELLPDETRPSVGQRYTWVRLAGLVGDPAAIPALEERLGELIEQDAARRGPGTDKVFVDISLLDHVCTALAMIGGPEAEGALLRAHERLDGHSRQHPLNALGLLGTPAAVRKLIAALEDDNAYLARTAAFALGATGRADAVGPLAARLRNDKTPAGVRYAAAHALGRFDAPEAVRAIAGALRAETDPACRRGLCMALCRRPGAVDVLIEATRAEEQPVRQAAVTALGLTGSDRAVPALTALLEHEEKGTRSRAALSLGRIGGTRAVRILVRRLQKSDLDARCSAAQALGDAGDPAAAEALRRAFRDDAPRLRALAARALGKVGGPDDVDALLEAAKIEAKRNPYRSAAAAVAQLGHIGGPQAALELSRRARAAGADAARALLYSRDPDCVDAARRGLVGDEAALRRALAGAVEKGPPTVAILAAEPLIAALHAEEAEARRAACRRLRFLGDPRTVPHLMELVVGDRDEGVRYEAVLALSPVESTGMIDPLCAEALIEALKSDASGRVRRQAAWCLRQMGLSERADVAAALEAFRKWQAERRNP
jgi:HEAT repeat protein